MKNHSEERLGGSEIFADKKVLCSSYIPENLPHRKEQITSLTDIVTKGGEDLYNILRINSNLNKARVSVICISNDLTFVELLDPRIKSPFGEKEIRFPPYNADQLKDILAERAVKAFNVSLAATFTIFIGACVTVWV